MTQIYYVYGEWDDYDSSAHWVVRAFTDRAKAEAEADRMTVECTKAVKDFQLWDRKNRPAHPDGYTDFQAKTVAKRAEIATSVGDPSWNSWNRIEDIQYEVGEVELV